MARLTASATQRFAREACLCSGCAVLQKAQLLHHFPAKGEDACLALRVFGFGDLAIADIHLGQGGPGEKVVGLEGGGHEAGSDGFFDVIHFEQRHAKRMPTVKELRIALDALTVDENGLIHFTDGEMAVCLVKKLFERQAVAGHDLSSILTCTRKAAS